MDMLKKDTTYATQSSPRPYSTSRPSSLRLRMSSRFSSLTQSRSSKLTASNIHNREFNLEATMAEVISLPKQSIAFEERFRSDSANSKHSKEKKPRFEMDNPLSKFLSVESFRHRGSSNFSSL